jgi:Xaa-Pro aminopeptidase
VTGVPAADRAARLRGAMAAADVGALLVSGRADVRWLTGFTGSSGVAYVDAHRLLLVTDGRYAERAADEAPGAEVVLDRTWGWLAEHHPAGAPLWLDAADVAWATALELAEDHDVRPCRGLVAGLRQIKDDAELAALRRACAVTDAAFADLCGWLAPGAAEREVARRLVRALEDLGADGPAFAPIVAAGPNGSRPHHEPGDRPIARGDLVTLDFGALVDGYHADMTRTVALGTPAPPLRRLHDVVGEAHRAGAAAVRDGAEVRDVDRAARDVVAAAGHAGHFPHGLGHGVGLAVHETPFLGPSATGTLADRMTVTVEPGVYVPGLGGVRTEDVVLVTSAGAERLTTSPRELLIL